MKSHFRSILAVIFLSQASQAADVNSFLIAKGQQFRQTNAAAPVLIPDEEPFQAYGSVTPTLAGAVTGATLRLPNSQVVTLDDAGDGLFEIDAAFTTKAQLDTQVPAGTYTFTILTQNDGTNRPALSLPADNYPTTPRISNWEDAQSIEPAADFTIQWLPFTNGTINDFIIFAIADANDQDVFSTPDFLDPNRLSGTNTSAAVPAGTLAANTVYRGRLLFVKRTGLNTNTIPGAVGLSGYYKDTYFPLTTLPENTEAGRIQLGARGFSVSEADPNELLVPIFRTSASLTGAVSVTLTISDGTARSGTDYEVNELVSVVHFPEGIGYAAISLIPLDNFLLDGNRTLTFSLSNPIGGAVLGVRSNAVVTILDNEVASAGRFQFGPATYNIAESGKQVLLTVTRSGGSVGSASVGFHSTNGSAEGGQDFAPTNGFLNFAPGQISRQIAVPILNDALDETNENFFVVLDSATGGGALGSNVTALVTIQDNDSGGVVAFTAATFTTNENSGFALLTVKRTLAAGQTPAGEVTVDFATANGTALASADYSATNGTLMFGSNELTKTFAIALTNDFVAESNETVLVQLAHPTGGATLGAISNATLTIRDDESSLRFTNTAYTVSEAGPSLAINVLRSGALITPVTVSYSTLDGKAASTNDYRGTNGGVLVFPANTSLKTIVIPIVNDTIVDSNETFSVFLHNPAGGVTLGDLTNTVVTIAENDAGGVINFTTANFITPEAGPAKAITLSRANGRAGGVSVWVYTEDGSATAGSDYTSVSNRITFNANETSKSVIVPVFNDALDETNETVRLFLGGVEGGAALGMLTNATLAITDDDTAGAFALSAASYATNENNPLFLITITRGTTGKASGATVDFSTQDGIAVDGLDYFPTNGTLAFGSNEVSKVITVALTNDALAEGNENFSFHLTNPTGGARLGAISNATLTIRDDESSVAFTNLAYTVSESGPSVSLNVIRSGALITPVSVNFSASDGSAISTNDYRGTNGSLSFPVNTALRTIVIPIANDRFVEGNEQFSVFLHSPSNGLQLGTLTNTTVTISDNDQGGVINFKSANFATNESRTAAITITRTNGAAAGVSVTFSTQDGSATAGLDYSAVSQTVTFSAGQTATNILVPILNDALDETNETVQLLLSNPQGGATLGPVSSAMLAINDDDSGGVFRFGAPNYLANENAGAFLVSVIRSSGLASNVTVDFFTQDGTALALQPDYIGTNGTLSFGAGETNKVIAVPIHNDTVPEGNEALSIVLTNATGGASLSATNAATLTIVDDESSISFTNVTYTVGEAGGSISLHAVRSGALGTAVSVDFLTLNGTAAAPGDYRATNGTLTFPANTALRTITVPIVNDFDLEGPESFSVRLTNPQGGVQIGTIANATVHITDDDAPGVIRFSSSTYNGNEGTVVNIGVQRTGGAGAGVTVQFNMVNGTASSNDYSNRTQVLTFAGGETNKIIAVNLNPDNLTEPVETVNLGLAILTGGATLGSPSTATLNINNASAITCPPVTFNLTGPGMKATGFTANMVTGSLVLGVLDVTGFETGLTTRTIAINLSTIPPGSTGSFPLNTSADFAGYSVSVLNISTSCSNIKTYNSEAPGTGCINILEWDTVNRRFKATFNFTAKGESSGTVCGLSQTPGPVPTDSPSITGGQIWVQYTQSP